MSDFRAGDVKIEKCMLKSNNGKREFNLIGQVSMIDIAEGVTQPLHVGEIVLEDGIGLRAGFPIIGEEYIELTFSTPKLKSRTFKLNVYKVGEVSYSTSGNIQRYSLQVISEEGYRNSSTLISRRYDDLISKTIENIITDDLKSEKKTFIDQTVGIDKQLISNLNPLQAIDKLRHRAVSSQYASSSFVFFESHDGFHFTTLEKMLKDAKDAKRTYYFDTMPTTDVKQDQFRNLVRYNPVQVQDTMQRLSQGAVRNVVKKFDIITGNVTDVEFDAKKQGDIFAKTGKNARDNSSKFVSEYNTTAARKVLMPFSSDTGNEDIADKKSVLQAFVAKVSQNIVHITLHGDSSLYLGEPIKCIVTAGSSLTSKKLTTQNVYVVTKIRHTIINRNRPVYAQTCEVINNSFDS